MEAAMDHEVSLQEVVVTTDTATVEVVTEFDFDAHSTSAVTGFQPGLRHV